LIELEFEERVSTFGEGLKLAKIDLFTINLCTVAGVLGLGHLCILLITKN